ncbi:MAG: hypothetical protein IKW92_02570 [Firmicutes bacterium]|nr:hypothetical protein [Bacillota bacterium]
MVLKIDHKGSEAFYTEVVNVVAQFRGLLKKPERKVENLFKTYNLLAIACAVMFVLLGAMAIFWGADSMTNVLMVLMAVLFVMLMIFLSTLKKLRKSMMEDNRTSVVTIDENGVELNKEDSQVVKLAWDNVAFVRDFGESIGFLSKDVSGLVISIESKWKDEVLPYLREIAPDLKIIE